MQMDWIAWVLKRNMDEIEASNLWFRHTSNSTRKNKSCWETSVRISKKFYISFRSSSFFPKNFIDIFPIFLKKYFKYNAVNIEIVSL